MSNACLEYRFEVLTWWWQTTWWDNFEGSFGTNKRISVFSGLTASEYCFLINEKLIEYGGILELTNTLDYNDASTKMTFVSEEAYIAFILEWS